MPRRVLGWSIARGDPMAEPGAPMVSGWIRRQVSAYLRAPLGLWAGLLAHTAPSGHPPGAPGPAVEQAAPRLGPWRAGELMVAPRDGASLWRIAADHGLTVERAVGRSGHGILKGSAAALRAAASDARIARAAPHGIVRGASLGLEPGALQWHVEAVAPPRRLPRRSEIVVAVLDTGVAYASATVDGVSHVAAPSLADSAIVAPIDLVDRDGDAYDVHGHGTHIASVIASRGAVRGIAPGVSILPVRVLDADKNGAELTLIEGIWHAIDHGADIINLSLTFEPGYRPSVALLEALAAAHEAQVVVVAAAGNEGRVGISWPAASPLVIAVGASRLSQAGTIEAADYSNGSPSVDLLAPGGALDRDADGDGYLDGILAEAIAPGDPGQVGYWFMAGTSQAAAVASGLAAISLGHRVPPHEVYVALQQQAGQGAAARRGARGGAQIPYAGLLPFLADEPGGLIPSARVRLADAQGRALVGADALISVQGPSPAALSCTTDAQGLCTVRAEPIAAGASVALAFSVDGVRIGGLLHGPRAALFAEHALEEVLQALERGPGLEEIALGWSWEAGWDPELGAVASAHALIDAAAGHAAPPLGLLLTDGALDALGRPLEPRAEGIALLEVEDMGPAALGVRLPHLAMLDAAGTSLPSGLRASTIQLTGSVFLPLDGRPVADLGPLTTATLRTGGFSAGGTGAASALIGAGALSEPLMRAPTGQGLGAVPWGGASD